MSIYQKIYNKTYEKYLAGGVRGDIDYSIQLTEEEFEELKRWSIVKSVDSVTRNPRKIKGDGFYFIETPFGRYKIEII